MAENREANDFQKGFFEFLNRKDLINNKNGLVVMAPTTDDNIYRIYSNGGRMADVLKTKVNFLPDMSEKKTEEDKGYGPYLKKALASKEYEKIGEDTFNALKEKFEKQYKKWEKIDEQEETEFREFLQICVDTTEKWSEAKKQTHEERKKETEIISYCRKHKTKKCIFVDMEFNVGPWKDSCETKCEFSTKYKKDKIKKRGGRVDLVVYDPDAGFGLIELKYDCKSMENLGKHFADFDGINNSTKKSEIINELKTRLEALSSVGIMDDSVNNIKEKLWFGFLLLGSNEKKYKYELKNDDNWNCFETHKKKKIIVDWMNLKKAIESKKCNTDFKFIWFKKFEDKNFSLCKADFQSYEEFMK